MSPTIKDIAQQVGMSVPTVSQILNNKGQMYRAETCRAVLETARRLGYRPNRIGRTLRGGRSMTVGIISAGLQIPITMLKVSGVVEAARASKYLSFTVTHETNDPRSLIRAIDDLVDHRVDGMVLNLPIRLTPEQHAHVLSQSTPTVVIGPMDSVMPHRVVVDRWPGLRDMVHHLMDHGHERFALFTSPSDPAFPSLRVEHYQRAFKERNRPFDAVRRCMIDVTLGTKRSTYESARKLLGSPDRPTALLMNNDDCAHAAIAAAVDCGLRVPEDISIAGYDDLPHVQYLRPALTTVRQPRGELGKAAFEMLCELMQDSDATIEPITMATRLVVRETTGPAPSNV